MLNYISWCAGVAELADALDLGSSAARRGGSTPLVRTKFYTTKTVKKRSTCSR